ncbi:phage tail protein [Stutzerimonas kunmingensis]|uniref:phage tail protein n=1 Tax=Stutzerimonas kunmingensis TaxID=1211807 RepID=UPI0037D794E9
MHVFSPSANAFFVQGLHHAIPADAVAVSPEQLTELLDGRANGKQILLIDGKLALAEPAIRLADLCSTIDTAADIARRNVAGDPLRAVEYDRARIEAQAFADAGYPADAVPRTVAAWAINGRTAQQAADSILAEAAAYTEALYVIRETRLAAKEQIRTLMAAGEVEQAQQLAEQTIAAIEAAVAGVGNAAA